MCIKLQEKIFKCTICDKKPIHHPLDLLFTLTISLHRFDKFMGEEDLLTFLAFFSFNIIGQKCLLDDPVLDAWTGKVSMHSPGVVLIDGEGDLLSSIVASFFNLSNFYLS